MSGPISNEWRRRMAAEAARREGEHPPPCPVCGREALDCGCFDTGDDDDDDE